ncbi:hypothetical protein AS594_39810 [Streptomyces agglomeratus]|uniref:Uncharacterized protein n=1 Tax=Streptomyces agglomeratus TaxID=285458 RepID=A0A1E5NZQ3_9ACTN|nr:hypothetical protein AS594_39810 [Streptomyces agglomeratus]
MSLAYRARILSTVVGVPGEDLVDGLLFGPERGSEVQGGLSEPAAGCGHFVDQAPSHRRVTGMPLRVSDCPLQLFGQPDRVGPSGRFQRRALILFILNSHNSRILTARPAGQGAREAHGLHARPRRHARRDLSQTAAGRGVSPPPKACLQV